MLVNVSDVWFAHHFTHKRLHITAALIAFKIPVEL